MFLTKLKVAPALLLTIGVLGAGALLLTLPSFADKPAPKYAASSRRWTRPKTR